MKKKLMMVAVLLGALSLGACVDDNESASVTDIRSAKAEQLRAVAALYQAQADAEAMAAQAEADLMAAQAEYERAKAAAEQANADLAQEQIRQLQEEFNYKIAALQAKWEAKVAYWNSLKAQYEGNLWDNEDENVQDAYARYSTAMDNVYTLTQAKMEQQVQRSRVEAQIVSAETAVQNLINGWNQDLADEQARLEKLNAMKEAQPSKDEYKAMMDELEQQAYSIINNEAHEALANKQTTKNAYESALESFNNGGTALETALETLNELATSYGTRWFANYSWVEIAEDAQADYVEEHHTYPEGTFGADFYEIVPTTVEAATLELNRAFEQALEFADNQIELATGKAWDTDKETGDILLGTIDGSVNSYKSAIAYYNQEIEDAEAEIERLETVLAGEEAKGDDADPVLIQQYKDAIEAQNTNITNWNALIAQYQIDLQDAQAWLNNANEDKNEILADQTEYTTALAALNNTNNQTAYQAAFDALEAPAVAYIEAQDASEGYVQQLADLGFEENPNFDGTPRPNGSGTYQDVKSLYEGIYDVQGAIDECENNIADMQARIQLATSLGVTVTESSYYYAIYNPITSENETVEVVTYNVSSFGNGITSENALALIDANIANLDAKIAVQQALVEQYYERLNSLLGLTGSEDTPAEPAA